MTHVVNDGISLTLMSLQRDLIKKCNLINFVVTLYMLCAYVYIVMVYTTEGLIFHLILFEQTPLKRKLPQTVKYGKIRLTTRTGFLELEE
jgi:hypothetical protein